MNEDDLIRRAEPEDARWLARLIDMAGEEIPAWLWSSLAQPGESPFEVGARRDCTNEWAIAMWRVVRPWPFPASNTRAIGCS